MDEHLRVLNEIVHIQKAARQPQYASTALVRMESVHRSKRCVLAYLHNRFERAKEAWWETNGKPLEETREALGPSEDAALDKYGAAVLEYVRATGVSLLEGQTAPKSLMVTVYVAEDCGTAYTSRGAQPLTKGSRVRMRRSDCEDLIKKGSLVHIPDRIS